MLRTFNELAELRAPREVYPKRPRTIWTVLIFALAMQKDFRHLKAF